MAATPPNDVIIAQILEAMGCRIKGVSRGYVHASCPLAPWKHSGGVDRNPSFGVVASELEAHKEVGHAHCFSCGYSGSITEIATLLHVWGALDLPTLAKLMDLAHDLKSGGTLLSLASSSHQADPFPDDLWRNSFPHVAPGTAAHDYLTARNIPEPVYRFFDVRHDPDKHRVCVPLVDRARRFRGYIGRTFIQNPMGPRYYYYPVNGHAPRGYTWFNEHNLDLSKPVLVVEGVFDAMVAAQGYPNTVAALSISFRTPKMGWHKSVSHWVTMFDLGEGGMRARERLNKMVGKSAKVIHLDPPPGRSDPGESLPLEIQAAVQPYIQPF